ncbi:MAG: GGDEF domain-containing protein [Burkholderiales bacterium]
MTRPSLVGWLLGPPGRQRVRAVQSLLALAVFVVFSGVQHFEVTQGLIDAAQSNALSAFNIIGSLLFFLAIRSGWSQRFASDPSLTFSHCLFGIVSTTLSYAITGPARGAVMGIVLLVLVFAMFGLSPQRIRLLAVIAFVLLASTMAWRSQTLPARYPVAVELTHLMFALVIVGFIAVLSRRMGSMRDRLVQQKAELTAALEQNRRLATLDELTGLVNRRHMNTALCAEHERQRRGAAPMSVVLIDIDLFKRINDHYGHAAGDHVLKVFAGVAVGDLRACDSVGRWGGEEFLVMMPATDSVQAAAAIDRLRAHVSALSWPEVDDELRVSFSAGVATCRVDETLDSVVERADQAMYGAKTTGRNRVQVSDAAMQCSSALTRAASATGSRPSPVLAAASRRSTPDTASSSRT